LNIIDTPGLIEGGYVNDQAINIIKRYDELFPGLRSYSPNLGLICGICINLDSWMLNLNRFLLNMTIDVLLYVDRLDVYRVDDLDRQVVGAITDAFGKEIWKKSALVLTHAQFSPPDGLNYNHFVSKRSNALLKVIQTGAQLKKQDLQV